MKISVFRAASMPTAMAELRAALGENAVILQTRQVGRGVEITAAADAEDDEPWLVEPEATDWRKPEATGWQKPEATGWQKPEATDWRKPEATGSRKPGGGGDGKPAVAAPPIIAPLPSGAPIFLVGMPGAGKTLTCVKLATRFVLAGTAPLLITTDGERAGAVEQLAAFTRVLGLGFAVATTRGALGKAIARAAPGQAVLVDTAGCNAFDTARAKTLLALMHGFGHGVLVQPAGLCALEASEEARAFHAMGVRHLLPTRLDVARRSASIIAAARAGLALTEAGTGPDPARGLMAITPAWLADQLQGNTP